MKIPKYIHQTSASEHNLHPAIKANIANIKNKNPDWAYKLWGDEEIVDFIASEYGDHQTHIYNLITPEYGAARADYFRYLLMFKLGGIYLDIKSASKRPLTKCLDNDDEFILSRWNQDEFPGWGCWQQYGVEREFQQWFIVCRPEHPFLDAVIRRVENNILHYDPLRNGIGREGVLLTTGPIPFSKAILPLLSQYRNREIASSSSLGLEYSFVAGEHKDIERITGSRYRESRLPVVRSPHISSLRLFAARLNRKLGFFRLREPQ